MSCLRILGLSIALALSLWQHAAAQTGQLLPEIDVYYKASPNVRLWFQAKETQESTGPVTAEVGPSIDLYLRNFAKLVAITRFDLDDSKSHPLLFSVGYRYLPAPGQPPTSRLEPLVTANLPLPKANILVTDRNRADLDWQNGVFTWRYRNRIQLERTIGLRSYHLSPYASAEFFYESLYDKWSDTAIYAGCLFPIGKHTEFNPYYEHQNKTGPSPNRQINQLGLMVNFYF